MTQAAISAFGIKRSDKVVRNDDDNIAQALGTSAALTHARSS